MSKLIYKGYSVGHPWYYVRGGKTLSLKDIQAHVNAGRYEGYLAQHISKAHQRAEPGRSAELRDLRAKLIADFWQDVSRYRQCACELRQWREENTAKDAIVCADIHTAISLKVNHLINGFANLRSLDALPAQADLFDAM